MKVFLLDADVNRYEMLTYSNQEDSKRIMDWFCGEPIGDRWTPLKVEVLRDDENKDRPSSDFPGAGASKPTFSSRALEALQDMLDSNGETLPLDCKDGEYWMFNVTRVVDALDEKNCEVKRFSDGGVMRVERYSFKPERIQGLAIFKILQFPCSDIYVTDLFVERVKAAGLTGFKFNLLWDSEGPSTEPLS